MRVNQVDVDIDIGAIVEEVKKATKAGLRAVAEDVASRARATSAFSDKSGALRRSIRVEDPDPDVPLLLVKAGGYTATDNYAPHAHLIEYGHAQVTKDGRLVGHTPARPFMGPARDAAMQQAGEVAAAAIGPINIRVGR